MIEQQSDRVPTAQSRRPPDRESQLCSIAAAAAAAAFGVAPADLYTSRRGRAGTAFARQAAMYLCHTVFALSFSAVGRGFQRDRTTVAHACRLVEDRREDSAVDTVLDVLETCWADGASGGAVTGRDTMVPR